MMHAKARERGDRQNSRACVVVHGQGFRALAFKVDGGKHFIQLFKATFDNTNLEKVDFRTAYNYAFDLDKNRIKKRNFQQKELSDF